jgi:DNA-binding CsgD family transcriptional regulator
MPSPKPSVAIMLTPEEREVLERRARSLTASNRDVTRAKMILLFVDGLSFSAIARRLDRERNVVRMWVGRFARQRLDGLRDLGGRGRKPVFPPGGGAVRSEARVRAA